MSLRIGVVTFPGSLDDRDAQRAVTMVGAEAVSLWHKDRSLQGVDAVVLPGGFSYGDYLRCGAISRFSPVMQTLVAAAHEGLPVLGICNGFQILCESHLLPGALTRNDTLHFVCRDQRLRIESTSTAWTGDYAYDQQHGRCHQLDPYQFPRHQHEMRCNKGDQHGRTQGKPHSGL